MRTRTEPTYVYVLSDGRGPKKIGCSHDPEHRCRVLRYGAEEYKLRVAAKYWVPGYARLIERETHRALRSKRLEHEYEWFDVTVAEAKAAIEATIYKWRDAIRPAPVVDDPMEGK